METQFKNVDPSVESNDMAEARKKNIQFRQFAYSELAKQKDPESVIKELISMGMDEQEASKMVLGLKIEPNEFTLEKKRNGFVTFWLWFGIVVNLLNIPVSVLSYKGLGDLGYTGMQLIVAGVDIKPFTESIHTHILIMQVIAAVTGIALVVCYALLLKWKKIGFWGFVVTAVIVAASNIIMMNLIKQDYALIGLTIAWNPIVQIITTPISLLILWAILQIRKDGVSCWKQLE